MFHSENPTKWGFPAVQRIFEAGLVGSCGASNKDARFGERSSLLGIGLGVHPSKEIQTMKLKIQENACGLAHKLIADGLDPNEVLEFYRGDVLCLRGKAEDFAKFRATTNRYGTPVFKYALRAGNSLIHGMELEEATLA